MERIIRLNAIEILCQSGIMGMNQHSLHPDKYLAPQKLTTLGANFASLREAFLSTVNTKCYILLTLKILLINLPHRILSTFKQKDKAQIKLVPLSCKSCEFMWGKVVFTEEDIQSKGKLAESDQVELLLEGKSK